MSKPMNVVLIDEYLLEGETEPRKQYTTVGVAFPHKTGGGFTIRLRKNLSVSGDVHIFPMRERESSGGDRAGNEAGAAFDPNDEERFHY